MSDQITPKPKRRRGAPDGNTNALKHGFYSRRFKKSELVDLDGHEFTGLQDEIVMLRVIIRRMVEMSKDAGDFAQNIILLRGICHASDSLTRLLKTEVLLFSKKDELSDAIQQALVEVTDEMKLTI